MSTAHNFAPLAATTGQPINLYMQRLWLSGQVLPAGARLAVEHVFQSNEEKPLEVIYSFPLPRDGALRSFRISGEHFEAHSELKETAQAVKAYEEGIATGSLSTLVRQYGDGIVNLTVGNIRPKEKVTVRLEVMCGVELRDDGLRFRFPFTLAPAYHAHAKSAATAAREGEIELPANEFGDLILPRFHEDASVLHQVGFALSVSSQLGLDGIGSPSHAVQVKQKSRGMAQVALAAEQDVPNRDLVLDAHFESVEPQVLAGRDSRGIGRFAAIVPSSSFGAATNEPRRVVILMDRSGSMAGAPMLQARKAIEACLGLLSDADSFGLVVFNQEALTFQPALVSASREFRDQAHDFLVQSEANGGTDLAAGIREAAKLLADGGGDILVLTDGQVFGTERILADARSAGVRLHCLGIGSASQDRFLALLARETGGISRFLTPRERVDVPAVDLFASIGRPVASGLKASANVQPEPPSFVHSGAPVLLFGEAGETRDNQINLTWDGGHLSLPLPLAETGLGETLRLLQGSRLISDWESRYPAEEATAPLEKRKQGRVAGHLLALSQMYGLASREMSLVAVVKREGDRAGQLPETRVVPLGMAQGTNFGAYFGRAIPSGIGGTGFTMAIRQRSVHATARIGMAKQKQTAGDSFGLSLGATDFVRPETSPQDILLDLGSRMQSDGGMPGVDRESRAVATVVALLAFLSQCHTPAAGAFRSHVRRLMSFLKQLTGLSGDYQQAVDAAIELASKGRVPAGEWIKLASTSGDHWKEVQISLMKA